LVLFSNSRLMNCNGTVYICCRFYSVTALEAGPHHKCWEI